ncbi:MAG: hypothetical protein WKG01_32895 [Kofleriaceae bacterium]
MIRLALISVLVTTATAAADPCAEDHWRIAYSKASKPIAIGPFADGPTEKPIYGKLQFLDVNDDARNDLVFESSCIRGIGETTRLHRVFTSCGKHAADRTEEYALVFAEEVPCTTKLAIARAKTSAELGGLTWHDLTITRVVPRKQCTQRTLEALRFDGATYGPHGSTRVVKACN